MLQKEPKQADRDIGGRIRSHRNLLNMSQTDLAEQLGITFQQIQKYEKGTNRVSGSRLMKMCEILKVSPNVLLNGKDVINGGNVSSGDPLRGAIDRYIGSCGKEGLKIIEHMSLLSGSQLRALHNIILSMKPE